MKIIISALIILLTFSGCINSQETVSTDGSTSMEKVIGGLGEAFSNETGIKFTYNPTGSGSGITAVLDGRCDIGLSSRELKESELSSGLTPTVLAYDGIALIVNTDNLISDLSVENIKQIYTGKISNWKEIGGNDAPIVLIGREAGSGTRDGFEASIDAKNKCKYRQELTSTGDVITTVSQNPDAVGYASVASIKGNVKILTVGGIVANEENIKNGSYLIRRPFIMVTKTDTPLSENAQKFFDFALSEEAEDIITMMGVVAVTQ